MQHNQHIGCIPCICQFRCSSLAVCIWLFQTFLQNQTQKWQKTSRHKQMPAGRIKLHCFSHHHTYVCCFGISCSFRIFWTVKYSVWNSLIIHSNGIVVNWLWIMATHINSQAYQYPSLRRHDVHTHSCICTLFACRMLILYREKVSKSIWNDKYLHFDNLVVFIIDDSMGSL